MAGYVIADSEVTDQEVFNEFLVRGKPFVEAMGGRYLVRGGGFEVVQGGWQPRRLVVIEFDTVEQARAWQDSPDYAETKRLLNASSNTSLVIVEGV